MEEEMWTIPARRYIKVSVFGVMAGLTGGHCNGSYGLSLVTNVWVLTPAFTVLLDLL